MKVSLAGATVYLETCGLEIQVRSTSRPDQITFYHPRLQQFAAAPVDASLRVLTFGPQPLPQELIMPGYPSDTLSFRPLPAGFDVHRAIFDLIAKRIQVRGQAVTGPENVDQAKAFLLWHLQNTCKDVAPNVAWDNVLCQWLLTLDAANQTFDLDEATRNAAGVNSQPPVQPNPISTYAGPQKPEPTPEPAPAPAAEASQGAPAGEWKCMECQQAAASLRGLKSHLTKSHQMDWGSYCVKWQLHPTTGLPVSGAAPVSVAPVQAAPTQVAPAQPAGGPPPGPGAPPLVAAPVIGYQSEMAPAPAMMAPPAPAMMAPPAPAMMAPPAPAMMAPMAPPAPFMAAPVGGQRSEPFVAPVVKTMDRHALAQALGGEITLLLVRIQDIKAISLDGYTDANQLARLAERQTTQISNVEDLADIKGYQKGDQQKARIFNDMLTANPNVVVITNGYNWVLDERLIPHLLARVTTLYRVNENGQNVETTKF
jgi:hypothetical protein